MLNKNKEGRFYPNFFSALLFLGVLVSSCGTARQVSCVRESDKTAVIRWGEINEQLAVNGYEARATGEIFGYLWKSQDDAERAYTPLGLISDTTFCALLSLVRSSFMKVQALNVPNKKNRFVEYRDASTNTELRALWTPEFDNVGNKQFRAVFDSLESGRRAAKK